MASTDLIKESVIELKPTHKRHDPEFPWQDFNIVVDGVKQNTYDFAYINVGGILLKLDMREDGSVRVRIDNGLKFKTEPSQSPIIYSIVKDIPEPKFKVGQHVFYDDGSCEFRWGETISDGIITSVEWSASQHVYLYKFNNSGDVDYEEYLLRTGPAPEGV